jgi:hypothetical protein
MQWLPPFALLQITLIVFTHYTELPNGEMDGEKVSTTLH